MNSNAIFVYTFQYIAPGPFERFRRVEDSRGKVEGKQRTSGARVEEIVYGREGNIAFVKGNGMVTLSECIVLFLPLLKVAPVKN